MGKLISCLTYWFKQLKNLFFCQKYQSISKHTSKRARIFAQEPTGDSQVSAHYGQWTMQGYVGLCRAIYGYVWLCVYMYGYIGLCMAMQGYVGLCMAMYGYVGLCMAVQGYVGLCMAVYGCVGLCRVKIGRAHV